MKEAIDSGKGICILCFSDLLRADARALFTQRGLLLSSYFSYIFIRCARSMSIAKLERVGGARDSMSGFIKEIR